MKPKKDRKFLKSFFQGFGLSFVGVLLIWAMVADFGLYDDRWDKLDVGWDILILCILIGVSIGLGFIFAIVDFKLRKADEKRELSETELTKQINENVWEKYE